MSLGEVNALLEGSIINNMNAKGCYQSDRKLICMSIPPLSRGVEYFIGFKCAFLNTAHNPQVNFASITIKSSSKYIVAGPTGVFSEMNNSY